MKSSIPKKMKAAFVGQDGTLVIREVDTPLPGKGEVLIKMIAAPINPSDLARTKNIDSAEKNSFIAGIEGCGIVVATGTGILPRFMQNKRVACFAKYKTSGTWAEYLVTTSGSCFPISRVISDDQAAMTLVNPLTALAFIDYAKQEKHQAIINNAAASALGRMVILLGKRHRIPIINVVRGEENVDKLREEGNAYVLNSEDSNFKDQLKKYASQLNATIYLDPIGGQFTLSVLECLPQSTTIVVYGTLSKENLEIPPHALINNDHKLVGFYLANWISKQGMLKVVGNLTKVNSLLKSGMNTRIQGQFSLESINEAIEMYTKNMSGGKILIKY